MTDKKQAILATPAYQYFSDILYWDVVWGALADAYGEEEADYMTDPYRCFEHARTHACSRAESTDGKYWDVFGVDFTFDLPEATYNIIVEGAKRYHFVEVGRWEPGARKIRLRCLSYEVTHDFNSWKKIHFEGAQGNGDSYHPERDEIVYEDTGGQQGSPR